VPIVMSNDGRRWACGLIQQAMTSLSLGLFANNFTPTPANILSDFVPPSFSGYSPVRFGVWGGIYVNPLGNAETDYPAVVFRVGPGGGSDTIYGYYVFDAFGFVIWSERNPAGGVLMSKPGDMYPLTPRFEAGALA
jgi:hypothetical protein